MNKDTLSFSFAKSGAKKTLSQSVLHDVVDKGVEETEFVFSVQENAVNSNKPVIVKEELVIPLIKTNNWRTGQKSKELYHPDKDKSDGEDLKKEEVPIKLDKLSGSDADVAAAKELIQESTAKNLSGGAGDDFVVPLLMKNAVPEGFETDDKLDVSIRPDEASEANYDTVPIEQFGMAMLRGMGWKQGQGIGKHNKDVKSIDAVPRPKGLGLGADRSLSLQAKNKSTDRKNDDGTNGGDLAMKKGAYCVVTSGKHKQLYAQVQGIDEENARVMVKFALSGETATISQFCINLVDEKHYRKYAKYLNKEKADKHQDEQKRKLQENAVEDLHNKRHKHDGSRERDRSERNGTRREDRSDRKRSHRDGAAGENRGKKHKRKYEEESESDDEPQESWLHSHLRVRIIDKNYKKGKYYKEKVEIEDVITLHECVCRTEDNRLLEGLSQSMLETVIPKSNPAHIMIVSGKYKRQVCLLVDKDKVSCTATVQFLPDRDKVKTLHYDQICEYLENVDGDY